MLLAANMHTDGFWTPSFDIASQAGQHFATLGLLHLPLVVFRVFAFLSAVPVLSFRPRLAQALFSALVFKLFFGCWTQFFRVSGL